MHGLSLTELNDEVDKRSYHISYIEIASPSHEFKTYKYDAEHYRRC
jgi:hypothetical protein